MDHAHFSPAGSGAPRATRLRGVWKMCLVSLLASDSITGADVSVWVMMLRSMRSVPTASTATLIVSSSWAVLVACR